MSLLRQGKAQLLTIYLSESDQWQGKNVYIAIMQFLRQQGCAGATVTRAIAGYGAGAHLHTQKEWRWPSDAPVIIQVVDQPARLRRLLPTLQEMVQGGLMTLQDIEVLKYAHARRQGISRKLLVRQIMETAVTTVRRETPVATVVELLLQAPFRVLPVVDEQQHLLGILSAGDLINAGLLPMRRGLIRTARDLDTRTAETVASSLEVAQQSPRTAHDIMNQQVQTIGPDQSIREAAQILVETRIRNLPVVNTEGTLLGILTRADLLQTIRTSPLMSPDASSGTQPLTSTSPLPNLPAQQQPVLAYTNPDVVTVEEETPFSEVIDALMTTPLKRVIVLDGQSRVKGIISDVDVLSRIQEEDRPSVLEALMAWARGKPGRIPTRALRGASGKARVAAEVMNQEVVTIVDTAPVQEAIEHMMATHRKVLPVVDQAGRLVGVVGRFDLLRLLVESEPTL
ncbi:MAG TPA: DUF190 domain-containing protein [Ktedonosporobacter sp.]|nr:DUF190 domain-containing protein [Ktedonosporobacter sp.]